MVEPISDVKPVVAPPSVATPVVPPTQAKPVSATPAAVSAVVPQKPVEVKPEPGMVPLPALQEERTKRQQLESEVAELRRMVTGNQYQQQQQQPQVDPRKELDQLWEQDPRKAVQVEIMYAMDWRDRIDSSLDIQADQLAQRFPDFNNYRSTTLGYVRNLPLNQRGTQGILEAAYFMVRGQNADTMLQQREADLLERYRRGEIGAAALGTPSGAFSSPTLNPGIQLTPEQHSVADAMGMTDAQYAANIKTTQGGR